MTGIQTKSKSWANDPVALTRLQKLVTLVQRTEFIADLMALSPAERPLLKKHIKMLSSKADVVYRPPRGGKQGGGTSARQFTAKIRFSLSVLMGLMNNSADCGLDWSVEGSNFCSSDLVDRLINTYDLFLQLSATTADEADVNFEKFVLCWREIQQGRAEVQSCSNCGSVHYSFHDAPAQSCPVCCQLKLATIPKQSSSSEWKDPMRKYRESSTHAYA